MNRSLVVNIFTILRVDVKNESPIGTRVGNVESRKREVKFQFGGRWSAASREYLREQYRKLMPWSARIDATPGAATRVATATHHYRALSPRRLTPQKHIINISARWSISWSQTVQYLCFLFVYQSNPYQHISLKFLISCDTCNDFQESSNAKRLISYFVCNHIALV